MIVATLLLGFATTVLVAAHEMTALARTGSHEATLGWVLIGHLVWLAGLAGAVLLAGVAFLRGRA